MNKGLIALLTLLSLGFGAVAVAGPQDAASIRSQGVSVDKQPGPGRYIVVLDAPTLLDEVREATGTVPGDDLRTYLRSGVAADRLEEVELRFDAFAAEFERVIGKPLEPVHRYTTGLNGFSVGLDAAEAERLAVMPGVISVHEDRVLQLHTDAGPGWIGADRLWNGEGGLGENRGEGVVVGVIDSGINWDHPSFKDPGETNPSAHNHVNPFGQRLGLCSLPEVECNDKLIGVFDFVEDNPQTEVVEENNNGFDNGTHGAHTAGTAVGNPGTLSFTGLGSRTYSGVAPNANVVSYRVCYQGDPDDDEPPGCQFSAILAAIDEAISNGVDVLNLSIGERVDFAAGERPSDPWTPGYYSILLLEAVEAGIFVVTSAGNSGRDPETGLGVPGGQPSTVAGPANAPWVTAVGSATHDRIFGGRLSTSGGGSTPPGPIVGLTEVGQPLGTRPIVYAGDYGNALCGTGESVQTSARQACGSISGASNPFSPGTFNGEIVVCDRGSYGRLEKGRNLQLAGAGGYILANVAGGLTSVEGDEHCLPSLHVRAEDGDALREWLANGSGHTGSLTGQQLLNSEEFADKVSEFSSRGPVLDGTAGVMKPNLIAPGEAIFAAGTDGNEIIGLSGTSMASPHVAGAAALLRAYDPDLTPLQIASILQLSATDGNAKDWNFGEVDHFDTGAGRPRLYEAATTGIYLDETAANFRAANPAFGGDPKTLNLASIADSDCRYDCRFTRSIGSFASGRTWTVSTSDFPDGVEVTVSPSSFTSQAGAEQSVEVSVDWSGAPELGLDWFFGKLHFDSQGFPRSTMPVSIFASFGEFPDEWVVETDASAGYRDFELLGVESLPQATYYAGGLVEPNLTEFSLVQDPTREDPYDGGSGVRTLLFNVPEGALWFHTETLASLAKDIDLYVGRDTDGDGLAEASEEVCQSTTIDDLEFCDISAPQPGRWWVVVQNWDDGVSSGDPAQNVTLESVVVAMTADSQLTATGTGITRDYAPANVRVSWNDVDVGPGTTLYGAVGVGSTRASGVDEGVIPFRVQRTGVAEPAPTALRDGADRAFALAANDTHDGLFIDVPPGVTSLEIRTAAETSSDGVSFVANNALEFDLVRVDYGDDPQGPAFAAVPGVSIPSGAETVASTRGSGGQGPRVTLDGGVAPGRYHAVLTNTLNQTVSIRIRADLTNDGTALPESRGLWDSTSRPGIAQGFEYNAVGQGRTLAWYTYDADGSATWYIANAPSVPGNRWTAPLLRVTNDGAEQFITTVGEVVLIQLAEGDAVFTWTLFGESGTERVRALPRTCPNNGTTSYSGLWDRGVPGLGGATVVANINTQAQVHYLYDASGNPRWLYGAGQFTDTELPFQQFSGFCPTCAGTAADVSAVVVGTLGVSYSDGDVGEWTLDYALEMPAAGDMLRTEEIARFTDDIACTVVP